MGVSQIGKSEILDGQFKDRELDQEDEGNAKFLELIGQSKQLVQELHMLEDQQFENEKDDPDRLAMVDNMRSEIEGVSPREVD